MPTGWRFPLIEVGNSTRLSGVVATLNNVGGNRLLGDLFDPKIIVLSEGGS